MFKKSILIILTLILSGCSTNNTKLTISQSGETITSKSEFIEFEVKLDELDDSILFSLEEYETTNEEFKKIHNSGDNFDPTVDFKTYISGIENETIKINMFVPNGYKLNIKSADNTKVKYKEIKNLPIVSNDDIAKCNLDYGFSIYDDTEITLNKAIKEDCKEVKLITYEVPTTSSVDIYYLNDIFVKESYNVIGLEVDHISETKNPELLNEPYIEELGSKTIVIRS